jgi:hypothetical protein
MSGAIASGKPQRPSACEPPPHPYLRFPFNFANPCTLQRPPTHASFTCPPCSREAARKAARAAELAALRQLSDQVAQLKADAERRASAMVAALECVATATRAVLYGYEQRSSDSRSREAQLHQQLLDRFGEVYSKLQRDAKNIRARLVDSDWRLDTLKQQQGQMATTKDGRRIRAIEAEIEGENRMRSIDEATLVKLK